MFDYVKRVKDWTTMACHVYDSVYCKVMTIAVCDMQSEDCSAQVLFWRNSEVGGLEAWTGRRSVQGIHGRQRLGKLECCANSVRWRRPYCSNGKPGKDLPFPLDVVPREAHQSRH